MRLGHRRRIEEARALHGRDLHGADLQGADLRGADLSGSILKGADLSGVRTGRPTSWSVLFGALAIVLAVSVGVVTGHASAYVRSLLVRPDVRYNAAGVFIAIATACFLAVLVSKGFGAALRRVTLITLGAAAVAGLVGLASGLGAGRAASTAALFVAVSALVIVLGTVARAIAGTVAQWLFFAAAFGGAIAARGAGGGVLVVAISLASAIVGRRALRGDPRYRALARCATALGMVRGTRFRATDVAGATFRGARLANCDFRGSNVGPSQVREAATVVLCRFDEPTEAEHGTSRTVSGRPMAGLLRWYEACVARRKRRSL